MKAGDVVILLADKIYEKYGKPVDYYIVRGLQDGIATIHCPNKKFTTLCFSDNLILISKAVL